jgi:acetyltransferase-like isoleucine patch superfamily enzyme
MNAPNLQRFGYTSCEGEQIAVSFEPARRALRALRYGLWALRSAILLGWYRCLYAGLNVGRGVRLGRRVYIRVLTGGSLELGDNVHVDNDAYLISEGALSVGSESYIGVGSVIAAVQQIAVGSNALIAAYATIRDQDHSVEPGTPFNRQGLDSAPVIIGDNVWVGTKATILKGVRVGSNAVIGAHALVNSDVAEGARVGGIPARDIGKGEVK